MDFRRGRIRQARRSPVGRFPLSLETPMPSETLDAIEFTRPDDNNRILKIWGVQLRATEELDRSFSLAQTKWNACIPGPIAASGGKFQNVSPKQLTLHLNIGGSARAGQSPTVFRLRACCRRNTCFRAITSWACVCRRARFPALHRVESVDERPNMDGRTIRRFEARQWSRRRRTGPPPTPLSDDCKPLEWRSKRYNISFRFGVRQPDELRACDDLKRSMSNLTCTVETPIQHVSCGNIAPIAQLLSADGGDWVMFKEDRTESYKQLPIDPSDQGAAIIALRHPDENRWYSFVARTLIFVSAADVMRYNVPPRLLADWPNRYLVIPLMGYFDDFAEITRSCIGDAPFVLSRVSSTWRVFA